MLRTFFTKSRMKEMDTIADTLWIEMATNPALGVSNLIEAMKYKEGFCSIAVTATLVEQKGYAISGVDQRSVQ